MGARPPALLWLANLGAGCAGDDDGGFWTSWAYLGRMALLELPLLLLMLHADRTGAWIRPIPVALLDGTAAALGLLALLSIALILLRRRLSVRTARC